MAMWDLIAVAMVRRKNLRTLTRKRRLGFAFAFAVGGMVSVEVFGRVVREGFVSDRVEMVVALDFLRFIGHDGSSEDVFGGGGRGEELISPMRRRVSVSWALVGTPSKKDLLGLAWVVILERGFILLHVELLFPIWDRAVQEVFCEGEEGSTEEAHT